ncbi:hypothetical protein JOC55_004303 [Paenibacillus sacheonensis]|nr:hypothetical protein [Paenibacillus sacheonensis]
MAVDTKSASVLIQDISPEGMQFLTYLRFPVSQDYRIRINLSFGEWQFSLAGHVNWRRLDENQYLHGCEFTPDPGIRRALSAALKEKLRLMIPEQQRIYELYRRVLDASQETAASVIDKRQ